ncbi:hypothetical protein [Streptomyces sp. NPDC051576]|uniref:hypothetical protein n=1 Tax=Streptomyces sp. NPDC051576 TaxID=3155803 RepID=UPI003430864B
MPGTVLLLAASPVGKGRLVDAASVLPVLAAVSPDVLSGTETANVVELADPLEPQAVLTRLRAAATAPGPLTVFITGQLQLDRKQHLPHLALARTTPATVRYTGFPWAWIREELRLRTPGTTTLLLDLHTDAETWQWLRGHVLDSGRTNAVYGRIGPPPGRRGVAAPTYMRAVATVLRSGYRPPVEQLHQLALARLGSEAYADILLASTGTTAPAGSAPRPPSPREVPRPQMPDGVGEFGRSHYGTGRSHEGAGASQVGVDPSQEGAGRSQETADRSQGVGGSKESTGRTQESAGWSHNGAGLSQGADRSREGVDGSREGTDRRREGVGGSQEAIDRRRGGLYGSPLADGRDPRADVRDPLADGRDPGADVRDPGADVRDPLADSRSPKVGGQSPLVGSQSPLADSRSPLVGGRSPKAGGRRQVDLGRSQVDLGRGQVNPGPSHDNDPHTAVASAAQAGRYADADALAGEHEQAAVRAHGRGSEAALHWTEVRADLAMLAGDPVRSCRAWLAVAGARLAAGQLGDAPAVEAAVDRAHHQWGQIHEPAPARELGLALAELRGRVPGRRAGALDHVRKQLHQLQAQG